MADVEGIKICVSIVQVLAVVGLGVTTSIIAWQQHKTAKNKLVSDLFERRYKIFKATLDLLVICSDPKNITQELRSQYMLEIAPSRFLFGSTDEVYRYLQGIDTQLCNVGKLSEAIKDEGAKGIHGKSMELAKEQCKIADWLHDQALNGLPKKLMPYLTQEA